MVPSKVTLAFAAERQVVGGQTRVAMSAVRGPPEVDLLAGARIAAVGNAGRPVALSPQCLPSGVTALRPRKADVGVGGSTAPGARAELALSAVTESVLSTGLPRRRHLQVVRRRSASHFACRLLAVLTAFSCGFAPLRAVGREPTATSASDGPPAVTAGNGLAQVDPVPAKPAPTAPAVPEGPRYITDWAPGDPIPPDYHPVRQPRKGALVVGLLMFSVGYSAALAIGLFGDPTYYGGRTGKEFLAVPFVGPLVTLAKLPPEAQSSNTTIISASEEVAFMAAAEIAGGAFILYSLLRRRHLLVRDDQPPVHVAPMTLGRSSAGVAIAGRF